MRPNFARLRRLAPRAFFWFALGIGLLIAAAHPDTVARALHLPADPWAHRLLLASLIGGMAAFLALAYLLLKSLLRAGKDFVALRKSKESEQGFAESGVVMVEFALLAPTVWWIMAMTVQMALIAQASIVVRYSAYTAARSAMVRMERDSLPLLEEELTNDPDQVEHAAQLVLSSLSPKTPGTTNDSAAAMRAVFASQNGVWGDKFFQQRYDYSAAATDVDVDLQYPPFEILGFSLPLPIGDIFSPRLIEVTVTYKYLTKIPGMSMIPGVGVVAPNGGWAFPITQVVRMQGTGARQGNAAIVTYLAFVAGEAFP